MVNQYVAIEIVFADGSWRNGGLVSGFNIGMNLFQLQFWRISEFCGLTGGGIMRVDLYGLLRQMLHMVCVSTCSAHR